VREPGYKYQECQNGQMNAGRDDEHDGNGFHGRQFITHESIVSFSAGE
jgi:hypothetical protein